MPRPLASGRDADVFALDDKRVLRRYRAGGDVAVEAAIMARVARHDFPVPRVYQAQGFDLVLERLSGPTMVDALLGGTIAFEPAARILADLHVRLHAIPTDGDDSILHLDLHPANVMLEARGPVVIDWRNATEGPADLDVAMTALIIAEAAVGDVPALATPAGTFLTVFLRHATAGGDEQLDRAVTIRRADPGLSTSEVGRLGAAVELIRRIHRRS